MDELRDLAGVTLGAAPLRATTWPPRQVKEEEDDQDVRRRALDRLEGRRGGNAGAREVPNLESWPYFEVSIADLPKFAEGAEEFRGYRVLDLSQNLDSAFVLASRWRQVNTGRSLGFTQTGAARLSSSVVTLPVLIRQLQGVAVFRQQQAAADAATRGSLSFFEHFLQASGADEAIAAELRAVVLGGAPTAVPRDVRVDAVVGVEKGSALAVWALEPEQKCARVEFLIGHDCLAAGPQAEEDLLLLVAARAGSAGAARLRCRARFTDDGKFYVPACLRRLGFQAEPHVAGQETFEEDFGDEAEEVRKREALLSAEADEVLEVGDVVAEAVPGLRVWLTVQGLQAHMAAVNAWCGEMGAATLDEVIEGREDLADALGKSITPSQRDGILKRMY